MDRPAGYGELKLFSGSAHPELAREIAHHLGLPMGQCRLRRFPDTEVWFQIDENIRGTDVFIVQPTCAPVDEHIMEMLIMIDAFRRSSAARITAVIPYYGYARQDRKDKPRVPISAKLVANILSASGVDRVLTMDLHKAQIQGFFDIPVDHLFAAPVIIDFLARQEFPNLTIVAPDAGGAERARAYAKRLGGELAVIDKRRTDDGTAEVMNVVGDVAGRTCIIQDDIIDTAGTIVKAANALKDERRGARVCLRGARRALGPGVRADREGADRKADRDQHDSAERRARQAQQDRVAVGRQAVEPGDPKHSRGIVRFVAVCVGIRDWELHDSRRKHSRATEGSRGTGRGGGAPRQLKKEDRIMEAVIDAVERNTRGKNEARRLRASGRIPAVVYGDKEGGTAIAVDPKMLARILRTEQGANTLIALNLPGGGDARVLVKEYQLDPVTHELLHADFYRVAMDKFIRVPVTVVAQGEPKGVKQQGGVLDIVHRQIEIECLPADIPKHIEVDVSELMVGQSIRVKDVATNPKWKAAERSRNDADARHHSEGRRGAGAGLKRRRCGGGAGRARGHQEGQEGRGRRPKRRLAAAAARKTRSSALGT